jgi:hypothetical protein
MGKTVDRYCRKKHKLLGEMNHKYSTMHKNIDTLEKENVPHSRNTDIQFYKRIEKQTNQSGI